MARFEQPPAPLFSFLIALMALAGCTSEQSKEPEGLQAFADRFREANRSADTGPMMDLYHLEGTERDTRLRLQAALTFELGLPIESIQFEPLNGAPEETISFQHKGVPYGPTLEPAYRMRVIYATEDQLAGLYTLGQTKDGTWRIVSAAPEPSPIAP